MARRSLYAIAACVTVGTAFAAGAADVHLVDSGAIEEVIVSAQKRESSLQAVPFSVAALTSEQLGRSGSTNIVDMARNVAGLSITDLGPGQSQVAIRGMSAGQVVRDQPGVKESVGVYLDESPISIALFTPDLDFFDLERIEVLRGPQGTLFGAGSASGTLRYITARPRLDVLEGAVEATFHGGEDSSFGGSAKAMLNAPLGQVAAVRVAAYHDELAGFIDSVYPGRGMRRDVNDGSKQGARVALRLQPNESLSLTPRIVYQKLETDGYPRIDVWNILGNPYTATEPAVRLGERRQVTQIREGIEDDFRLADLTIEYTLGDATFTAVSSYTDRDVVVLRDASQLTGSVTTQLGGVSSEVRMNSPLYDSTDLQAFSQELRVALNSGNGFDWLVGLFYQEMDRRYGQNLPTPGYDAFLTRVGIPVSAAFLAPSDTPFLSDLQYDFRQFAAFGEGTVHLNEQWSLTGGLRYYDFEEDRLLTFHGLFVDQVRTDEPGSTSSDGFSPRLILAFEPTENVKLNLQAARGFRLGGINDPLNEGLCPRTSADYRQFSRYPTWDDETVTNYELGAKTRLADGRVILNAAAFYSDIEGLQVISDAGSCSSRIVLNAQAETLGGEVELFARVADWDLGLSATYVKAEISETQLGSNGQPVAGIRRGNRLPTSPRLQAASSITYNTPWVAAFESYVTFTVQHVGSSYTQLGDQEPGFGTIGGGSFISFGSPTIGSVAFDPKLPDYQIGSLRFGVKTLQWHVAAFINNLWDERAYLSLDRERGGRARIGYLTNQPRTYGITVQRTF